MDLDAKRRVLAHLWPLITEPAEHSDGCVGKSEVSYALAGIEGGRGIPSLKAGNASTGKGAQKILPNRAALFYFARR